MAPSLAQHTVTVGTLDKDGKAVFTTYAPGDEVDVADASVRKHLLAKGAIADAPPPPPRVVVEEGVEEESASKSTKGGKKK